MFHACSQGGYKINFEYSDLEYDESLLNIDIQLKRSLDKTVVNVRAEQYNDIEDPLVLHVSHYEKVDNDYQHLVNTSMNVCNVLKRVKSHPILKLVMKELLKASNIPMSCPIKKVSFQVILFEMNRDKLVPPSQGIYYMKDFSLNEELLPPFLPIGEFMSHIRFARVVNDVEVLIMKLTVNVDIDYAKERKSFKLF